MIIRRLGDAEFRFVTRYSRFLCSAQIIWAIPGGATSALWWCGKSVALWSKVRSFAELARLHCHYLPIIWMKCPIIVIPRLVCNQIGGETVTPRIPCKTTSKAKKGENPCAKFWNNIIKRSLNQILTSVPEHIRARSSWVELGCLCPWKREIHPCTSTHWFWSVHCTEKRS